MSLGLTQVRFAELNRIEFERFGKLIKDANVKTETWCPVGS